MKKAILATMSTSLSHFLISTRPHPPQLLPLVDHFEVLVLKDVAHLGPPSQHGRNKLPHDLLLVSARHGIVPLLEAALALTAEQKQELDLHMKIGAHRH